MSAATYDWSTLEESGVMEAIERVVSNAKVTVMITEDDLFQEACLAVAKVGSWPNRHARAGNMHHLHQALKHDLSDLTKTERRRENLELASATFAPRNLPLPAPNSKAEEEFYEPVVDLENGGDDYNEEIVLTVIPALWDESYFLRLDRNPRAADADMPKGSGGKPQSNTHWALIADVRRAWEGADLSLAQKRAILVVAGMGYSLREAGSVLGVTHAGIRKQVQSGIQKMCDYLNGVSDG